MKKMKFDNANVLSRYQLKNIIGGAAPIQQFDCSSSSCPTGQQCCPYWDGEGPITYSCEVTVLGPSGGEMTICPA